jgi:hypothetical protein
VLNGTHWLLLKNPENLNGEKGEQSRLQEALKLNQPLATAYYLKDVGCVRLNRQVEGP